MKKIFYTICSIIALNYTFVSVISASEAGKRYIKLETGYTFTSSLKSQQDGILTTEPQAPVITEVSTKAFRGALAGLGLGYNFTQSIRGDIVFQYANLRNSRSFISNVGAAQFIDSSSAKNDFRLMGNVYYDFHNNSKFVPFIGASIGGSYIRDKINSVENLGYTKTTTNVTKTLSLSSRDVQFKRTLIIDKGQNIRFPLQRSV